MAIGGAKPKPKSLALLQGDKKALCNKNKNPPICTTGDLENPPDFLTDSQREVWDYYISNSPKSLLKKADMALLVTFVIACDLHRMACLEVAENGMIQNAPNTGVIYQNPYMAIINKQALIMQKAASEIGFSPCSRSRVSIEKSADEENPFLNRGKRNE